jgi:hypothetical protein
MIIGGIQDPNKVNNMHLLFYKTDNYGPGNKGDTASYEIKIDVKNAFNTEKDFELFINQA